MEVQDEGSVLAFSAPLLFPLMVLLCSIQAALVLPFLPRRATHPPTTSQHLTNTPPPQVYGLPCLIVFKDGKAIEESHHEGAVTKKALVEYLAKHGVPATANA